MHVRCSFRTVGRTREEANRKACEMALFSHLLNLYGILTYLQLYLAITKQIDEECIPYLRSSIGFLQKMERKSELVPQFGERYGAHIRSLRRTLEDIIEERDQIKTFHYLTHAVTTTLLLITLSSNSLTQEDLFEVLSPLYNFNLDHYFV